MTSIELGTTKLAVLISRPDNEGVPALLGMGQASYDGFPNDHWESDDKLKSGLYDALGQARKMSGIKVSHCTLAMPNEYCGLVRRNKEIKIDRAVGKQDVTEIRKLVGTYSLPAPWRISDTLYGSYIVDGHRVGNPIGMECSTFGLEASLICIDFDFAKRLMNILSSLGMKVDRIEPVLPACGEALMTPAERHGGSILIDIGGYSTDFAVYENGIPVMLDWLPLGGETISQDIAQGTGVSQEEAGRLKRYCVLGLAVTGETTVHNISLDFLQEIVEARIEEILQLVRQRITDEGLWDHCRSVVLTGGGTALFRGIRQFGAGVLGLPVRLAVPDVIGISSPALASVYSAAQSAVAGGYDDSMNCWDLLKSFARRLQLKFNI